MSFDIVKDSLKYYDFNNEKYKNIMKRIKFIKFYKDSNDIIRCVRLIFLDKKMNELFRSRVEVLGKYYTQYNTWIWGWSIPDINSYLTTIIRKVFLYGTDIHTEDKRTNLFLKNELITSRFKIDSNIQIDIHCAISSYLSKIPLVFRWYNFPNRRKNDDDVFNIKKKGKTTFYFFILDTPTLP